MHVHQRVTPGGVATFNETVSKRVGATTIEYSGCISYELGHEISVVNGQTVSIEFVHKNARLTAEFMWQIIEETCAANFHNAK